MLRKKKSAQAPNLDWWRVMWGFPEEVTSKLRQGEKALLAFGRVQEKNMLSQRNSPYKGHDTK